MRRGHLKNRGIGWIPLLLAGVAAGGILWYWFRGGLVAFALDILNFIAYIVLPITDFFFRILSQLAATIINVFISLNPFADYGAASILWEFFKNIAYVVIVFLALIAGFEWILNREDAARRLLLGLLLIAFLINFTFVLAKEIFIAIWYLQIGILQSANLGGEKDSQFGSLLYAALSIVPPTEVANKIVNELSPRIAQQAQEQGAGAGSVHNIQVAINISGRLLGIFLNAIYSIIMWMFAGIAIGRFLILSFLVGVLPLACVAYTTPWYKSKWDEWWKMFFTWNVNILILIPLILIGIALIATQGSFNEVKIQELFLNPVTTRPFGTLTGDAALIIAIVIRSIFIALYFCFVVVVALTWGGRAADYGYRFGKWLWGSVIGGALLWAGKEVAGKPALDKLGSGLEKLGDTLAMFRFGVFRSLGARVKDLGEGLRKPVKKDIETQAKAIWEQIKDKSPEEIAQIIQRYPVALQKEIAKLAEKEKGADELIKIAGNIDLQKAAKTGVLKNLCGRTFDCNLTRLVTATEEEERIRALNQIAGKLDWRTANLGDLSSVLTKAGIEARRHPLLFTNMYTYVPNKRNFWTPENIRWLAQQNQGDFIEANLGTIRTTPAYRAVVQGGAVDIAAVLEMDPQYRKVIENALLNFYKSGEMETKLQEWEADISKFNQDVLEPLNNHLTQQAAQLNNELNNLNTQEGGLNQRLSSLQQELQKAQKEYQDFLQNAVAGRPGYEQTKQQLENNIERLNREIGNVQSQLQDLDRRRKSIQANIDAIDATLNQLQQIRSDIQSGQFANQQQLQNLFVKLRGALKTPSPTGREAEWERRLRRLEEEQRGTTTQQQPATTTSTS
jgi:chaperonin cofactor prefoldin